MEKKHIRDMMNFINSEASKWIFVNCNEIFDNKECLAYKDLSISYDNSFKNFATEVDHCVDILNDGVASKIVLDRYYKCIKKAESHYKSFIQDYYMKFKSLKET